jgi:TatD DNase family protein
MIQRAKDCGIDKIYMPNIDGESIPLMISTEQSFPDMCIAMMGLHPCSVNENFEHELSEIERYLFSRPFSAVGEIGLDFYWDKTFISEQKEAFRKQINWAKQLDIPIVIHSRDSTQDVIGLVSQEKTENLRGIFHCFGGSVEEANQIIELGFYLGIGGVLTYKKSGLDETLKHIDLKYIVLETDAPYLSPVPFRGKRNEPAYIEHVAKRLSEVKNIPLQEIFDTTTNNAKNIFR